MAFQTPEYPSPAGSAIANFLDSFGKTMANAKQSELEMAWKKYQMDSEQEAKKQELQPKPMTIKDYATYVSDIGGATADVVPGTNQVINFKTTGKPSRKMEQITAGVDTARKRIDVYANEQQNKAAEESLKEAQKTMKSDFVNMMKEPEWKNLKTNFEKLKHLAVSGRFPVQKNTLDVVESLNDAANDPTTTSAGYTEEGLNALLAPYRDKKGNIQADIKFIRKVFETNKKALKAKEENDKLWFWQKKNIGDISPFMGDDE